MNSAFNPCVHVNASQVNYRRRGRYILRAWREGPYDSSIYDFMDNAVSELLWHIPSGISVCTQYEILRICRHGSSGGGLYIDFVMDIR